MNMRENYFDFHERDTKLLKQDIGDYSGYCDTDKEQWLPFLSFPITKKCNFHCVYCGVGGEATSSNNDIISLDMIRSLSTLAIEKGIKKFRITGGEPFTHPDIKNILAYFSDLGYYTLINTNGSLICKNADIISQINKNIRFAVSLDTLIPSKINKISRYNRLDIILDGLQILASNGLLLRCNMVVGRHNIDEIPNIIKKCQELGCDLKLLDIVSVPVPYGNRDDYYQEINSLEEILLSSCDDVYTHEYTRGFGTPCYRYRFGETYVTVKNSQKGSHYDRQKGGLCESCKYFPCHEGLYDIFALSDGRLCCCRWTEQQISADTSQQLDALIKAFQDSKYHQKPGNKNMQKRVDLE